MVFTIVIPLHNKRAHVKRAIDSVLAQTVSDFELIVVDDASTDAPDLVLKSYCDHRLRILRREVAGPGGYAARNLGIRYARADWVAFLDADDEWYPSHLERICDSLRRFPGQSIVSAGWQVHDPELYGAPAVCDSYYRAHRESGTHILSFSDYLSSSIRGQRPIWTSVFAVHTRLIRQLGGFPAGMAQRGGDVYTFTRAVHRAGSMLWSNHLGAIYHRDSENMVTKIAASDGSLESRLFFDLSGTLSRSDHALLRKYTNRRRWHAFVGRRVTRGRLGFKLPKFFWRGDILFCASRFLAAMLPAPLFRALRTVALKSTTGLNSRFVLQKYIQGHDSVDS